MNTSGQFQDLFSKQNNSQQCYLYIKLINYLFTQKTQGYENYKQNYTERRISANYNDTLPQGGPKTLLQPSVQH